MREEEREFASRLRRLLAEFPFIHDLDENVQVQVPDIARRVSFPNNHVLFREGDTPDALYIVLSGEVSIWKRSVAKDQMAQVVEGTNVARRNIFGMAAMASRWKSRSKKAAAEHTNFGMLQPREVSKVEKDVKFEPAVFGGKVASLLSGTMLGEIGLLADKVRNATAVCQGDHTELLTISKKDFDLVLKDEIRKAKLRELAVPMRHLLQEFPFFKKLSPGVQAAVVEGVTYTRFPAGSVVFRQGDAPDLCYIILSGEVAIWRNDLVKDPEGPGAPVQFAGSATQSQCADLVGVLCESMQKTFGIESPHVEFPRRGESFGVQVARLGAGLLFGELALLENVPRSATVTCKENCEFLTITKKDFQRVLSSEMRASRLPEQVKPLVNEVPFFKSLRPIVQQTIPFIVRYVTLERGSTVFEQGDNSDRCYLLVAGEVALWKQNDSTVTVEELAMDESSLEGTIEAAVGSPALRAKCDTLVANMSDNSMSSRGSSRSSASKTSSEDELDMDSLWSDAADTVEDMAQYTLKWRKAYGIQVGKLGQGSICGEHEMLSNKAREFTATCYTDCHFLVIDKQNFDHIVRADMRKSKLSELSGHVKKLLREYPIFKELDSTVQDMLPDAVGYVSAKNGAVIFEQGEQANLCYIILAGQVAVWIHSDKGRRKKQGMESAQTTNDPPEPTDAVSASPSAPNSPTATAASQGFGVPQNDKSKEPTKGRKPHIPPPSSAVSLAAREKSFALAAMLSERQGWQDDNEGSSKFSMCALEHCESTFGKAVASLGSGELFGELGLQTGQARNATVTAMEDCEFLIIERQCYDQILKEAMVKAKEEKIRFIGQHLQALQTLPEAKVDAAHYYFIKRSFPRHHRFFVQGEVGENAMFLIWSGSVEFYFQPEPLRVPGSPTNVASLAGARRLGVLTRGGAFGAMAPKACASEPFTVVATSSPCEVLQITSDGMRHLPEPVSRNLQELVYQAVSRRLAQCSTCAMPAIAVQQQHHAGGLLSLPIGGRGLPTGHSSKSAKPASTKIGSTGSSPKRGASRTPSNMTKVSSTSALAAKPAPMSDAAEKLPRVLGDFFFRDQFRPHLVQRRVVVGNGHATQSSPTSRRKSVRNSVSLPLLHAEQPQVVLSS